MIHIYCGDGKGKSTAAIGLLVRACGNGARCQLIMFDKGSQTYKHHEIEPLQRLGIKVEVTGCERMTTGQGFRTKNNEQDLAEAARACTLAETAFSTRDVDVLVLDEVLSAYTYGLLTESELIALIKRIPATMEVILTGRCEQQHILAHADLVTRMSKVRHYFDQGVAARPGIEY